MFDILAPLRFKTSRDYSLTGPERQRAFDDGLVNADWYQTPVDRKVLKELMKRKDGPALRDTAIWLGLLGLTGAGGVWFWGTWWTVPFFVVYGVLYGTSSDSRWHESLHGSAFKTSWMNEALYQLASFMQIWNPVVWRWSHMRHHTDTTIVGRDREIGTMRPPQMILMALNLIGLTSVPQNLAILVRHARNRFTPDERDFVPENELPKAAVPALGAVLQPVAIDRHHRGFGDREESGYRQQDCERQPEGAGRDVVHQRPSTTSSTNL